jgi:alcohol dehydrogenase
MIRTRRSPRQLIEGDGAIQAVGPLACELGSRAFVVTDRVITQQAGFAAVTASLEEAGLVLDRFEDALSDVPLSDVERCLEHACRFRPDLIVAVGGGTVIDLAKVVAALLVHGGEPQDYYGENLVPGPVLPVIAVPTTAGTGSEVTTVAVLSDPDRELKVGISSVHMVPAFAVCDPQMTYTCPSSVTAFAGIDAVCHAVEAYTATTRETGWREVVEGVSIGKNDLADDHALRALAALAPNLPRVVEDGRDREARAAVMRGATDAGVAFSHAGTAGPHALQYPMGAATKTPHGLGVGLFLPYVLTANRPEIDGELTELADCIGVAGGDAAEDFIEWTVELNSRIGVPASLQEIGVERDQLRRFAELTTTVTRLLQNNRGDNSVEGLERVLVAAWEGDRDLLR